MVTDDASLWSGARLIDLLQSAVDRIATAEFSLAAFGDSIVSTCPPVIPAGEFAVLKGVALTFVWTLVASSQQLHPGVAAAVGALSLTTPERFARELGATIQLARGGAEPEPAADPRMRAALLLIRAGCCGGVTVDHVAREVRLSRWHLERLLRKTTGQSFTEHVRTSRLSIATELLGSSFLSVKEIAARLGYGSSSSFGRDFRRGFGMAPIVWRLEYRREYGRDDG